MTQVNINIRVNNGSEKFEKKNTATSGKLTITVYDSVVYVYYISCTCLSSGYSIIPYILD
jgi:hypothetical protein